MGNHEVPRSPPSYRAVAEHTSTVETYAARYSLPESANYVRKSKLSLLLSSDAHSGRSGCQADIHELMSAWLEASSEDASVVASAAIGLYYLF